MEFRFRNHKGRTRTNKLVEQSQKMAAIKTSLIANASVNVKC